MKLTHSFVKHYFIMAAVTTLLLLSATGCQGKKEQAAKPILRPVKLITVEGTNGAGMMTLPGKTRASQRADLSFKVAGALVELPVEEGQAIEKGQIIARIDPRDFKTNIKEIASSLSEANANLKSMRRGARVEDLRMLKAEVEAATAEYQYAKGQYKRYKQLWTTQHASRADFDRQVSLRNTAKARLEVAKQDLVKGKSGARKEDIEAQQARIRALEARLEAAKDAFKDTHLRAPFDGVVAKRYVENHQEIQAKQPIVFFQDNSSIEVVVDVPESHATQIRKGELFHMAARFATAPDRTFPLYLKEFSTEIDPHTLTYQAVLVMPHPQDVNILPGMTATVEAKLEYAGENSTPRIVIPATAVTMNAKMAPYVWCLHEPDMEVARRNVRIGELTGSDGIEILAGLKSGDRVVTAGVTKLRDGMKVAVWDESK